MGSLHNKEMGEKDESQKLNEITVKYNDIADNKDHSKEVTVRSTDSSIEEVKKIAIDVLKDDFRLSKNNGKGAAPPGSG